jgi:hypothetical protein
MYISIFYVLTHNLVKKDIFVGCVKKKACREKDYFNTEFYYFFIAT